MPVFDPPVSGARVRMYRPTGLGDCFLLAFRAEDGSPRYVLIDCGVFNGTKGGSARMKAIASDIAEATGGHLHVLVLTHEHWDHLSGFQYAQSTFESITVDHVWAAWTENPTDPLAIRLQRERDATFGALVASVRRLKASPDQALVEQAKEIDQLVEFMGELPVGAPPPVRFGATSVRGTAAQMDAALALGEHTHYLSPGDAPLAVPDVSDVEVFVLGPPRNEAMLRRSDPRADEVYDHSRAHAPTPSENPTDFAAAVADGPTEGPFHATLGVALDALGGSHSGDETDPHADLRAFLVAHYGVADAPESAPAWRRIDGDWLGTAESLALQLDSDTNNSSLVLAFRLADGRVLLFPGDAQVGNWLSWHGVSWDLDGARVSGTDLLRQTALYKVGHHASHNATLRDQGLELMTRSDLVALLPVDEPQARKKDWSMPFPPLLDRLHARCAGRVIRADTGLPERPEGTPQVAWDDFLARTDEHPDGLWVQVDVLTA